MDRDRIKKLAKISFRGNNIDQEKVLKIAKLLKKTILKEYIRYLKRIEEENTIIITVSNEGLNSLSLIEKKLKKIYPNKKLVIKIDKSLIAGVKIQSGDIIYETNIKQMLEEAVSKI